MIIATATLFPLRELILWLFEAHGETRQLILLFCGPLAHFSNGVIFVAGASFNNLGHPSYPTAINWGRHTLVTWPLAMAGAALWGAAGALVGQAVGGVIFAALAASLAFRLMKQRPGSPRRSCPLTLPLRATGERAGAGSRQRARSAQRLLARARMRPVGAGPCGCSKRLQAGFAVDLSKRAI